ncbi:MAG: hypothetical protein ACXWCB_00200 [Acidimicrobiales bacterium]
MIEVDGPSPGYWSSRWPAEDGGPLRRQLPHRGPSLDLQPGEALHVESREAMLATMVVLRDPGEVYLLRHTAGDGAVAWVERIDPVTLEPIERSPDLPGGPMWPGGLAAHANGSIYVVFGRHAHRLAPDCSLVCSRELPRDRPYNSFVVLPDGHLAAKDFAGALGPGSTPRPLETPSELVVLEPEELEIVDRLELAERSIARLSADGDQIYVVGDTSLLRVRWTAEHELVADPGFRARYRTIPGQTYGWDAVLDAGAAWFLDDGDGSERFIGTLRGQGTSTAPLHLVRVSLDTGAVSLTEICGLPGGLVANPPAVDPERGIVVGYDTGNGVLAAFRFDERGQTEPLWQREQDHGCHMVRFADTGELVTFDHDRERPMDQVVVLDVESGRELARADTGSPAQSVVFSAPGFGRDLYLCSLTTVTRVWVA